MKAEAAIKALESRQEQHRQEFRREVLEELTKAEDEEKLRAAELDKASRRSALKVLASPVDGKVQQLAIHTIGGVVQPAEPLMLTVMKLDGISKERRDRFTEHTTCVVLAYTGEK